MGGQEMIPSLKEIAQQKEEQNDRDMVLIKEKLQLEQERFEKEEELHSQEIKNQRHFNY